MIFKFSTDSEFLPVTGDVTKPISVAFQDGKEGKQAFYLHPDAPIAENFRQHETFKTPFAPFDFYNVEYRDARDIEITSIENGVRHRKIIKKHNRRNQPYAIFEAYIFFSYKDLQFLFQKESDYREFILPEISRIRRISSQKSIRLPWDVYIMGNDGKMRWHTVTLKIRDICALQGNKSLDEYAKNVGVTLDTKHTYTKAQKSNMVRQYEIDPYKFEQYNLGDLKLIEIYEKTTEFYNEVARKIEIPSKDIDKKQDWGMSTGKIVATMVSEYLSQKVGIESKDFYRLTDYAGSKGITELSKFLKNRNLIYCGMTDGGRAQRERLKLKESIRDVVEGILLDIDISSCYGSGLLNQKFAVGNPTIISESMTLRQFLKKYKRQFVAGLWCCRISCKKLPFSQDLIMSKVNEAFSTWTWGWNGDYDGFQRDDNKYVYDSQLIMTTDEIHQGIINHDILQVLKNYSSDKKEWSYLLDNAIVESALIYEKRNKVDKLTNKMIGDEDFNKHKNLRLKQIANHDSQWIEIDLRELLETLISERKKYAKKTPLNEFLKLVINTIYGCCCSEFFSSKGTGISNVVIANNITARARTLAWCMAKGFGSHITVTDGGVFDVNKVMDYKQKSLDIFAKLHINKFTDSGNGKVIYEKSLADEVINKDSINELMKPAYTSLDTKKESDGKIIDVIAWEHLKNIFGKLDIFKFNQFSFESKKWYTKLTIHSKVDYRLVNEYTDDKNIKMRGVPQVWDDINEKMVSDPRIDKLFDCIERGISYILELNNYSRMLSQSEWERHPNKNYLLPHDQINKPKLFFSHVPLAIRPRNMIEMRKFNKEYCKVKESRIAENLRMLEIERYQMMMEAS